jgi:hypothetical protein
LPEQEQDPMCQPYFFWGKCKGFLYLGKKSGKQSLFHEYQNCCTFRVYDDKCSRYFALFADIVVLYRMGTYEVFNLKLNN